MRLADGDQLVLHENCPADWRTDDGAVMLVHGLCGCHQSRYIERIGCKLLTRGVRVFRLDLRGCGAGEGLARTVTHCGRHSDLESPIQCIEELTGGAQLTLIGFSLGGALALNLAATSTTSSSWVNTIAVCPPVDLHAVEQLLRRPLNSQYDKFFARRLWKQVNDRARQLAGAPSVAHLSRPTRLRQFDQDFTAPLGGYRDADDYYEQASVISRLADIEMRTLIVATADDPIVPIEPLRSAKFGPRTEFIETPHGGHLGFIGRRGKDPDRYWLDWRIVEWVVGGDHASRTLPSHASVAQEQENR